MARSCFAIFFVLLLSACGAALDPCPAIPKTRSITRCGNWVFEHEGHHYSLAGAFSRELDVPQKEVQGCVRLEPGYHKSGECYFYLKTGGSPGAEVSTKERAPFCAPIAPC